ncbi:MAG: carotenoid biosynthesis protein [Frankia sp.]
MTDALSQAAPGRRPTRPGSTSRPTGTLKSDDLPRPDNTLKPDSILGPDDLPTPDCAVRAYGTVKPETVARLGRETGPWVLAAVVVAIQIAYPLIHGDARDRLTIASVIAFCAASLSHAAVSRGGRWVLGLFGVAASGGLLAEAVGVHTGVPFGSYSYASSLGPRLFAVPLVIPLAWVMMAYPALLAGRRARPAGRPATALTGGAILATWDLFLDPQMVDAGHWRWHAARGGLGTTLNGIPLSNLVGWLLVATLLIAALDALPDPVRSRRSQSQSQSPTRPDDGTNRAGRADDRVPFVLLGWTYASSVLANLAFFGRPAVALTGGFAMGAVLAFVGPPRTARPRRRAAAR